MFAFCIAEESKICLTNCQTGKITVFLLRYHNHVVFLLVYQRSDNTNMKTLFKFVIVVRPLARQNLQFVVSRKSYDFYSSRFKQPNFSTKSEYKKYPDINIRLTFWETFIHDAYGHTPISWTQSICCKRCT